MDKPIVDQALPAMLTADEASTLLRVRKPQLYALARDRVIPVVRVGRQVRFNRDRLLEWIDNGGSQPPAGPQ